MDANFILTLLVGIIVGYLMGVYMLNQGHVSVPFFVKGESSAPEEPVFEPTLPTTPPVGVFNLPGFDGPVSESASL